MAVKAIDKNEGLAGLGVLSALLSIASSEVRGLACGSVTWGAIGTDKSDGRDNPCWPSILASTNASRRCSTSLILSLNWRFNAANSAFKARISAFNSTSCNNSGY